MVLIALLLQACAGMEPLISAPGVSLRNVQVKDLDYSAQVFVLSFDVTNPNPFPLPIRSIAYGVELDGRHFAGGRTESAFTVAPGGDAEFAISVELDLLHSAPQLLYIVHDGATGEIPYRLKGEFGLGIPMAKPVSFESSGEIRLFANNF